MSKFIPLSATRSLKKMGENIAVARKRRGLRVADVAKYTRLSEATVSRMERGDAGVSMGAFFSVMHILGELQRVMSIMDADNDKIGLIMSENSLPKGVRKKNERTD